MRSLSRHLTISLAVSLVCFFLVQALLVGVEMRSLSEDTVHSRLEDDMEGILAVLSVKADASISIDWTHVPAIFMRPFSGHYFQIQLEKQKHPIRSRSLWDEDLPANPGIHRAVEGPENQQLLVFCRIYHFHGQEIVLSVAEDTSTLEANSLHFQKRLLAISLLALLMLLVIQVWVIRRGLKPLSGLREELQQLERGEKNKLEQPVPVEIKPLVDEVNHLLAVLQQRLERSRRAMGNLSHALKTPLTLVFQILEKRQGDKESTQLLEQAQRMDEHINRELSRARMAGQSSGGVWLQPEADLRDLAISLNSVYRQRVHIDLQMSGIREVFADREDMMELIGNLLDNACKWSKERVSLTVYQASGLYVDIEDDGPGMTPEAQTKVIGRGVRLDETKEGHGLGLAIVRDVVDAYDGRLEFGQSDKLGGLKVSIRLPKVSVKKVVNDVARI